MTFRQLENFPDILSNIFEFTFAYYEDKTSLHLVCKTWFKISVENCYNYNDVCTSLCDKVYERRNDYLWFHDINCQRLRIKCFVCMKIVSAHNYQIFTGPNTLEFSGAKFKLPLASNAKEFDLICEFCATHYEFKPEEYGFNCCLCRKMFLTDIYGTPLNIFVPEKVVSGCVGSIFEDDNIEWKTVPRELEGKENQLICDVCMMDQLRLDNVEIMRSPLSFQQPEKVRLGFMLISIPCLKNILLLQML